jgi:hypothetical protein
MVPERGLEPPLPCENQVLNLARLPIPPFGHNEKKASSQNILRAGYCFVKPPRARRVTDKSTVILFPPDGVMI